MRDASSFTHAYIDCLRELSERGRTVQGVRDRLSVGSRFGSEIRPTIELLAQGFELPDPRVRLLHPDVRKINLGFAVANAIWVLSGSSGIEMIASYNSRGRAFSQDGKNLESAFGPRLFGSNNVWKAVQRLLVIDPSSRRAFAPLFYDSDVLTLKLDTPCAIGLHFLVRDNTLEMVVIMRAQSAAMVMPYDVFLFCFLHECFSLEMGIAAGRYYHFCSSCHYYLDEAAEVERILASSNQDRELLISPKLEFFSEALFKDLSAAEVDLRDRLTKSPLSECALDLYSLPSEWMQLLGILRASLRREQIGKTLESDLDYLRPQFRLYF